MHDFTVHLSGKHTAVNINITYSHTNIREKTAKEEEKKTPVAAHCRKNNQDFLEST